MYSQKYISFSPCDSFTNYIQFPQKEISKVSAEVLSVLKNFQPRKNDKFSYEKIDDSTFTGSGIFQMVKGEFVAPNIKKWKIKANSDGYISYKFIINIRPNKIRYQFIDINHYGSYMFYGDLCQSTSKEESLWGLKCSFYFRALEIVSTLKKVLNDTEW